MITVIAHTDPATGNADAEILVNVDGEVSRYETHSGEAFTISGLAGAVNDILSALHGVTVELTPATDTTGRIVVAGGIE